MSLCKCGCGQITKIYRKKPNQFLIGHNSKLLTGPLNHNYGKNMSRENNPNWKGGIIKEYRYIKIHKPDHPNSNSSGYVYLHRLVYEHYLKILFDEDVYLPSEVEIDHETNDPGDNSFINLNCFTKSEHTKIHHQRKKSI